MSFLKKQLIKSKIQIPLHLPEFLVESRKKQNKAEALIKSMEYGDVLEIKETICDPREPDTLGTLNSFERKNLWDNQIMLYVVSITVYERYEPSKQRKAV